MYNVARCVSWYMYMGKSIIVCLYPLMFVHTHVGLLPSLENLTTKMKYFILVAIKFYFIALYKASVRKNVKREDHNKAFI